MPVPKLLTPKQIIVASGGGNYIVISSIEGATLTCGSQTYTLGSGETIHAFSVDSGTYTCVASMSGYYSDTADVSISNGFEYATLTPTFLPVVYQQVEYLQADASGQYIDTGIVPEITSKWVLDIKYANLPIGSSYQNGVAQQSSADRFLIVAQINSNNTTKEAYFGMGNGVAQSCDYTERHIYTIDLPNNQYGIDSSFYSHTSTYTKSANYTAFLFWRNSAGSFVNSQRVSGCIYSSKIYNSGTLIQELVPCYRKSDSVLGMYDKVADTFLTNSGTGTFTAGPDVN